MSAFFLLLAFFFLIGKFANQLDRPKNFRTLYEPLPPPDPRTQIPRAWSEVADQLHLGMEAREDAFTLYGHTDDFEVTIEARNNAAEIRVRAGTAFDSHLRIARRGVSDGRTSVITGDDALDRATIIDGNRAWILATFDLTTRELVLELVGSGPVYVSRGSVRAEMDAELAGLDRVVATVRGMIELARCLSRSGTVEAALRENAMGDLDPRVRLENLRALIAEYRDGEETKSAATLLLNDPDLEVRRCAAGFLRLEAPSAGGLSLVKDESSRGALSFDRATGGLAALPTAKEEDDSR